MPVLMKFWDEVTLFQGRMFSDERGVFYKFYDAVDPVFTEFHVKQVNYVTNFKKNTLRGLHYQEGDASEAKIFRVLQGKIQLGFINIRKGDPNYLKNSAVVLDSPEHFVRVPRGHATGYCILEDNTNVLYFSDNEYFPEMERGVRYNDPVIGIDWPGSELILTDKDKSWPSII